jgi:hypothetical protein
MNIEKQLASYKNIKGFFASPKTFLIGKEMPIHMVLNLQIYKSFQSKV